MPRLAVCLSLLALCVVALRGQDRPSPAEASRDHDGRGALAVLRRDGLLFPFASFDRDSWRATWPSISRNPALDIPTTREGIPKEWWGTRSPDQWRVHLTGGDDSLSRGPGARSLPVILRPAPRRPHNVSFGSAASTGAGRSVSQRRTGDQRRRAPRAHRVCQPIVSGMGVDGGVAGGGVRSGRERDH